MKKMLKRLGWSWLLIAPVMVALWGWWQVGAIACDLEMHAAVSNGLGFKAGVICPVLGSNGLASSEPVSPADIASVRIAVVGFLVATLFATIGVLAGYQAFVANRPKAAPSGGLACLLATEGLGTDVVCSFVGDVIPVRITDLTMIDASGGVLQTMPDRDLGVGEVWSWTVLAGYSTRHSTMGLRAVVTDARGKASDVSAAWKMVGGSLLPTLFTRTWR